MIETLLLLLFNSLLIYGFYYSTTFDGWEGYVHYNFKDYDYGAEWKNINWWLRYYGADLPMWVQKVVFRCPQCMASFHGGYVLMVWVFVNDYPLETMWLLPFYVLALSGVNLITGKFID